jgi:hypothetical protein
LEFSRNTNNVNNGTAIAQLSERGGPFTSLQEPIIDRRIMKRLVYLLSLLLICAPAMRTFAAGQSTDKATSRIEKTKKSVAKLGVGSKAKATITLNDGSKVKGYVYSAGDEDFVMRDRKTDAPTTIKYVDVKSVDDNRGHRYANMAVLFVVIGAAVTLAAVYGAIAANER